MKKKEKSTRLKIILHFMDSLILSQVESAATEAYKCL